MLNLIETAMTMLIACASICSASEMAPEMIVRFSHGALVCLDRNHLSEITIDVIKGEYSKAEGLMVANGGDCVMVSPDQRFKILSVEYNLPESDLGILEIVGWNEIRANGAWAWSPGAEEINH